MNLIEGNVPSAVSAVVAAQILSALGRRVSYGEADRIGQAAVQALRTEGWNIAATRTRRLAEATPLLWDYDPAILAGLARGRTGQEIAAATDTPHATVRQRIRRLRSRTGAPNAAGLVAIAYRSGWLDGLTPEPRGPIRLTPAEARTLELLALGRTNPQIADELGVPVRTAVIYLSRLYDVLDAARPGSPDHSSRCRAVALGFQHGLLTRHAA